MKAANEDRANSQENELLTKRTLVVVAAGTAVIALLLMIWRVAQILLLVFASLLLALFLRSIANFISRNTRLSILWSLALVVIVLLGILGLMLVLYGPMLADGFYQMFRQFPSVPQKLRATFERYEWGGVFMDTLSKAGRELTNAKQLSGIAGIFSTTFGALGSTLFVFVLSLYLAAEPELYLSGIVRLFPKDRRQRVSEAIDHIGHVLRWWLLGRIAAMFIVGVMVGIGLAVLGVPFAFLLALVAALLDFIPNIGPLMAAIPAIMVGMTQGGNTALYIVILYIVIQVIEGYLVSPLIEARVVSLPPALQLTAQLMLGAGFGILGVLLASPLAVVIMVLVQMLYIRDVLGEQVELP